jgi:hypothetical protein
MLAAQASPGPGNDCHPVIKTDVHWCIPPFSRHDQKASSPAIARRGADGNSRPEPAQAE